MTTVWDEANDVKETALLVLLSIADHAGDDDPVAWPSVKRLAQRTRCDERTIQRALVTLEEAGWLTRTMRPGHSTMYRIHRPGGDTAVTPDKLSPPTQVSPHPRQGRHPSGDSGVTQNHQGTITEPSGGVSEVTTEPPPQNSVTERPFPRFAIASLGEGTTLAEQQEWTSAWTTVTAVASVLDPTENLTKYLARCKERKTAPRPTQWISWFIEDQQAERRKAATDAAAASEESPKPWFE